ncbi:unnamed protein product, partial [Porites lobata]
SINEFNLKQGELIKRDLNGDPNDKFKQLCSSQNPVTKGLFGDDLPKSVKEINETNKVDVKNIHKTSETNIFCFTEQRFENVAYIDDTYLKGNTFSDNETNVSITVRLFTDLALT